MPNNFFKDRETNIGGGKIFFRRGWGQIFFVFFLEKGGADLFRRGDFFLFLFFFLARTPSQVQKKINQKFNQSERSKLHNSQNRKFVGAAITVTKNNPPKRLPLTLGGFLLSPAASFLLENLVLGVYFHTPYLPLFYLKRKVKVEIDQSERSIFREIPKF